ncbi:MAG: GGDEF domain-containing protein [Gaiellales bacterium]
MLVDEQTGLASRRAFHEALLRADSAASGGSPVSIVLADVRHLAEANEEHGHAFGDRLLRIVADLLVRAVPEATIVARVGGDEFALLLEGIDEDGCASVASDVEASARHHPGLDGRPFALTVGYASCPPQKTVGLAFAVAGERLVQLRR